MRFCTSYPTAAFRLSELEYEKHRQGHGALLTRSAANRQHKWLVGCLLALLFLFDSHQAIANECSGNPATDSYTFPSPISVPRDRNAVGPLTNWVEGPLDSGWWSCSGTYLKLAFSSLVPSDGATYTEAGQAYTIVKTSLPGVGVVMAFKGTLMSCGWVEADYRSWNGFYVSPECNGSGTIGGQVKYKLIQTGPISAGTTATVTPFSASPRTSGPVLGNPGRKYFTINPVTFNTLSCSAEGMNVTLPSVKMSEFSSSITPGVTPFQFTLRNCPAGMDSVTYQVSPMSPIITSIDGTFANDTGTGMALGVGLRITNSANTAAVDFATTYTVADYNPTSDNSTLPIPMNVSYFRTGTADAVTPGRVQGALQLTVFYK